MSTRTTLPCLIAVLLGALILLPANVEAQRFKWWHDDTVKRHVGLTAKQTKKLDDIFNGSMPDLAKAKHELDLIERGLVAFADSSNDDAELRDRVNRVETARAELNTRRSVMLFRMRRILSVEQRAKLESLQQERDRRRPQHEKPAPPQREQ